jgi:YggT family protein
MNPVQDSFSFLINTVFQLYMLLVLLRFLFQLTKVNFRNPIIMPVVKLTQIPLAWLRRFVPGLFGVDLSAIVLFILLGMVKLFLLGIIGGEMVSAAGAVIWSIAKLLDMSFWIIIIAIFMQAILSWFMPQHGHPATVLLADLTRPVLRPIRNLLPAMGGMDFSPIVALIALNFLQRLVVSPLYYTAAQFL